jgi:pimeloyl-ACP methyl ester carboxylesterase
VGGGNFQLSTFNFQLNPHGHRVELSALSLQPGFASMSERQLLYHRVEGNGDPLLLLNGIAMSVNSWQPISERLAEHYRVIRCDLRGQLMSPATPPEDVGEHADDVVALLDHLDCGRVHVLATSFGGVVAALLAARHPERVRSLVSVASTDAFDDLMAVEVARWKEGCVQSLRGPDRGLISDVLEETVYSPAYRESHREERRERRRQIATLPDSWFEGLIGLLESAPTVSVRQELRHIRCPTLVVAAALDRFIPLERTRELALGIPGARFTVMEGAGHAVVVEQPDELVKICLDFLEDSSS